MSDGSRVPRTIPEFKDYINDTDDYLLATDPSFGFNYLRLGIPAAKATDWHTKRVFFRDTLYPAYSNGNTRTPTIVHQLENFMKSFRTFANPLLNLMAASLNAVEADETALNFKIGREEPVRPTEPIAADCIVSAKGKGQGTLRISCKRTEDASRASIPRDEGAKAVELRYKIGGASPTSVEQCTLIKRSSKALFTFNVGAANAGQKIYIFAHWIDTANESRAGAFSEMATVIIS